METNADTFMEKFHYVETALVDRTHFDKNRYLEDCLQVINKRSQMPYSILIILSDKYYAQDERNAEPQCDLREHNVSLSVHHTGALWWRESADTAFGT